MVFKKLAALIHNFISLKRQLGIKDVTLYRTITLDDVSENHNEGGLKSLEGTGSSSLTKLETEGEFCCVCLSKLKEEENMRVLPCLHKFHKICIDRWFNVCRKTCPVCRFAMREEERSYKREEQFTEEMVIWFSSFHVAGF